MKYVIISFIFLLLIGCGQEENQVTDQDISNSEEQQQLLYQSDYLQIGTISGWTIEEKAKNNESNVIFRNDSLQAIISVVNAEQSEQLLKQKVLSSFSQKAEVIKEEDHFLSVATNRKENLLGDVYFYEGSSKKVIVIFMTSEEKYEENQLKMEEFRNNLDIL